MSDDKTRILPDMANTGVGTQLSGIYELDERIASGGMGEVYRGHNIQTGDHVAIKIVLPEFARDQTILSLFRKEASILNHLSHDAIVRYHVFTIDPGIGRPYLAMEFVDGQSLFDVMRSGPMLPGDVRKLCHRLASGLSFVHEAGAVHRDLSPDNIILPGGRVERAKIIDFGIARSATVGGETLIGGRFAGKYNYVSPEQLGLYGGEVSERSDIYSLGLVLAAVLRGKPLEMSGSQFEIVEKRRSVPDLSDIDDDFRLILEEMLQPNPQDRPTGAEIARMTRDEIDDSTLAPRSIAPRDSATLRPQIAQLAASDPWVDPSAPTSRNSLPPASASEAEEPGFVPHVPAARLSPTRPTGSVTPATVTKARPTHTRTLAIAAAAIVVLMGGGAYYMIGIPPQPPTAADPGDTQLVPDESAPPQKADEADPANQQPENPIGVETETPEESTSAPTPVSPDSVDGQAAQADDVTDDQNPPPDAAEPPSTETLDAQDRQAEAAPENTASPTAETAPPPTEQPVPQDMESKTPELPNESGTGDAETDMAAQPSTQPVAIDGESAPDRPEAGDEGTEVAIEIPKPNVPAVPKPEVPATDAIDVVAQRISWLRDYSGGDCFYASTTSATDKEIEIEGFSTSVEPFTRMLEAFQEKFQLEPVINVRPIEAAQCEVTGFLRTLGTSSAEKPNLVLDRTSVPNGAPISGSLETRGGLRSSLLLIDHKGMVFNLDERIVVEAGKATFSIPIGLGAADKAAGKAVPQIILAVTGRGDIAAATFSTPTPASVALPKILAEIQERKLEFSATAKYFQLGG